MFFNNFAVQLIAKHVFVKIKLLQQLFIERRLLMKTYIKKILPIILAISIIICPVLLCTIVTDFGGAFTTVVSAADAGDLVCKDFGNGTCYINGFRKTGDVDKSGELIIPETLNGLTVIGISNNAFKDCTELTKVVIPDTVTTVEFSAFQGCTSLETIVMSDNVTSLGSNVFTNTAYYNNEENWENSILYLNNYLISVKKDISGEVIIKDGSTLMVDSAFSGRTNITKVTIPGSLSIVSKEAFYNCSGITEVVLLEGVKELGTRSFWNCPKLVKMTIPASIKAFGQSVFGNTRIKEPYYNGTVDQWVNIDFDSSSDNPIYTAKTLYINGEELTKAVISAPVVKEYAFNNCQTLEKVTFTDSVAEIQESAFSGCNSLKEIEFGKGIKKIDSNAFEYCSKIEKVNTKMTVNEWSQIDFYNGNSNPVTISKSLYINGELLEAAVFSGITSIEPYTFCGCASLKTIHIPDTVEVIGKGAFSGTSIKELTTPENVTTIEASAFAGTSIEKLIILEGVTTIEDNAFSNCESLKTVVLPSTLTKIDSDAFSNSSNINYVNFNGTIDQWASIDFFKETSNPVYYSKNLYINGELAEDIVIENVENYAFINCESLKNVYISDGVKTIGRSAFEHCSNLEIIDLPNTITHSYTDAFLGCSNLKKTNYRGTVDEWAHIIFNIETSNPVNYSHNLYLNDVLLENAVIKEATRVGDYAFINCDSIKTLVVGGNVEKINGSAFRGCDGLISVDIQGSTLSTYSFAECTSLVDVQISEEGKAFNLSSYAFYKCSALEEIVLPTRITGIGNSTFQKCTSLKTVYLSTEIRRVGFDAFYDCPSLEILYYESDKSNFQEIKVQTGNEALFTAETHYNVADIESHYTTVTVHATCTEDGYITRSCPCGYSSFTIIHAANHKQVLANQKDATCTTDGYTGDMICEACKEVFEKGNKIDAYGHTGGTATCSKQAQCERCHQYYNDMIPHSYTSSTDAICNQCGYERALDVTQNPAPDNVQKPVQDDAQNPNTGNPYFTTTGLTLVSILSFFGIFVLKRKRRIAK